LRGENIVVSRRNITGEVFISLVQPVSEVVDYDPFAELPLARKIIKLFTGMVGIQPNSKVLDVGAGTGESALEILEYLGSEEGCEGHITMLEPEANLLEVARTRLPERLVDCARGFAQDLEKMNFPAGAFDFSVWSNGIHYVTDPATLQEVLQSIRRATKTKFSAWSTFMSDAYVGKTARFAGLWVLTAYRNLGIDPKTQRAKSESLQTRGAAEYVEAFKEAGFSDSRTHLETFELGPEVYQAIARFGDYVNNALPPIPDRPDITLQMRSDALVEAAVQVYERLGVQTLPRNWLYVEATP